MRLPHALRAFRHRDFRLYFIGQGLSQVGTWLQLIATSWLIYRLSGSAFLLGVAAFAQHAPFLILGPFAGVWVDRLRKRRVLYFTQCTALAQSLVMLALVATGTVEPWHLVAANLVHGCVSAIDSPARHSMLIHMVGGKEDLPSAIAFGSAMMNTARFVGPLIGGAVIAAFGEVWGFGLNAFSYVAVILAWAMMSANPAPAPAGESSWLGQLSAGFRWAYGFLPTRSALLLLGLVSLVISPYQSLAPYFAKDVFGGDSRTLGILVGAGGFGAVSGLVYLAARPSVRGLFTLMPLTTAIASVAMIAFTVAPTIWLATPCIFAVGLGMLLAAASVNTMLQTIVPDALRARVASIYMMSFLGTSPIGALIAGAVAERIGPPLTLAIGGGCGLAVTLVFRLKLPAIRREIRPIYEKLGIAPRTDQ